MKIADLSTHQQAFVIKHTQKGWSLGSILWWGTMTLINICIAAGSIQHAYQPTRTPPWIPNLAVMWIIVITAIQFFAALVYAFLTLSGVIFITTTTDPDNRKQGVKEAFSYLTTFSSIFCDIRSRTLQKLLTRAVGILLIAAVAIDGHPYLAAINGVGWLFLLLCVFTATHAYFECLKKLTDDEIVALESNK